VLAGIGVDHQPMRRDAARTVPARRRQDMVATEQQRIARAARSSAMPRAGDSPTRTPGCWRLRVISDCT
jgi:hypothetical protein